MKGFEIVYLGEKMAEVALKRKTAAEHLPEDKRRN
jgi:hypothetical protein